MFKKAKENSPCLIFIDEIDAVGRSRGAGMGQGNDEREQTLNQMLTEMDGFEGNTGACVAALRVSVLVQKKDFTADMEHRVTAVLPRAYRGGGTGFR